MRRHLSHGPSAATRLARVVVLLLLVALGVSSFCPTRARADGDPASDVLLAEPVFYPFQPMVSPGLEAAMKKTMQAAGSTGLHVKVAIIGSAQELGLVPNLFGHPQAYAQFLYREISFNQRPQLLVVMPAGFGAVPASLTGALSRVPVYAQEQSNGLTRSAILAVVALARYEGHPIATPAIPAASSSGGPPALLVFGLPVALLALAGLAAMRRGRSKSGDRASDR